MIVRRLAVVFGGVSSEHEVSMASGEAVLKALEQTAYEVTPVIIDRDGSWAIRDPTTPLARQLQTEPRHSVALGVEILRQRSIDLVFVALHGIGGEDGTFQELLDTVGLRYTGSDVASSSLCFDKATSKNVVQRHEVAVAKSVIVSRDDTRAGPRSLAQRVSAEVGLPCFVKPNASGSSVGAGPVKVVADLIPAIERATAEDLQGRALIERYLVGRELSVGVIERGGCAQALPPVEIRSATEFFDYDAKYTVGMAEELCPAPIPEHLDQSCRDAALRCHEVLGCSGFSRVDFIEDHGVPYFLECNTIPGLTPNSLLPKMARANDLTFERLIETIIEAAAFGERNLETA